MFSEKALPSEENGNYRQRDTSREVSYHPKGAFFWVYSGIGLLGIDGIVFFRELFRFRNDSVHSASDIRMNRMNGIFRFQNG